MITKRNFTIETLSEDLMEFNMFGVGADCQQFREYCESALRSLGPAATQHLLSCAASKQLTPRHGQRILAITVGPWSPSGPCEHPVAWIFMALGQLIRHEPDEDIVIHTVARVTRIIGRELTAGVLIEALECEFRDRRYAIKLIDAAGSISDAISPIQVERLRQIAGMASWEVAWRCRKLLTACAEHAAARSPSDPPRISGYPGVRFIDWLLCNCEVSWHKCVTDPDWLWLRAFRYRPPTRSNDFGHLLLSQ